MIYLDYAASSVPFCEAIEEMRRVSLETFGNPGSLHIAGAGGRRSLQKSRFVLAEAMNVHPEEIFFTSGGTEANNWALRSLFGTRTNGHLVCSATEHSSILKTVEELARQGLRVTWLKPDRSGRILPEDAEAAIQPNTLALCVHAVNNETGVIQDVDGLAAVADRHRIPYFCDGVQSFGHADLNLHKADLISLSAHKFGGPKGVGCLVVRRCPGFSPMILGGGQEFGLRSGTENTPAIAGMAAAAKLTREAQALEISRQEALRDLLAQSLRQICPDLEIAGEASPRTAILCCRFPGITGEEMVMRLDLAGICASPGAACAARDGEPSRVLRSMGYSPTEAAEFLRFSPGRLTTEDEIFQTVRAIGRILEKRS